MAHTLYELDVRLREIEPAIWRAIELPGVSSLEDVHFAIQVAMGWTNSHLHQFIIDETNYGMAEVDGAEDLDLEDERQFRLQDLVKNGSFVYEYDFGDGCEHEVTVTKVTTQTKSPKPRCTAGARACPPEDCGGVGGYENLLEALRDPKHEEHESSVTWSGNFKAERFAIPKNGLDLQKDMKELKALADSDGPFEDDGDELLSLPKPLVEAVLALEPLQRASLGALIAGSLADELEQARSLVDKLAMAMRAQTPARHGRKRARS